MVALLHEDPRVESARASFTDAFEAALDELRPRAAAKGVRVERAIGEDPAWVRGDAARLRQMARKILADAIEMSDPGGAVWVELWTRSRDAVLTVRDGGGRGSTHVVELPLADVDDRTPG
jgi:signal transduction histidine kinase